MIAVYIEVREGKIKKASLETLSEGKRLADEMNMETAAVFVGSEVDGLASEAFNFGAGKVYVLDNSLFSQYSPSGYTEALFSLIEEIKPEILFMAATAMGKDLAPRLAAKLGVSIASDCTQVKVNKGELEVVRPIFAGKALASFRFKSSPVMATLRPNVFPLAEKTEVTGETIKKIPCETTSKEDQIPLFNGFFFKHSNKFFDLPCLGPVAGCDACCYSVYVNGSGLFVIGNFP